MPRNPLPPGSPGKVPLDIQDLYVDITYGFLCFYSCLPILCGCSSKLSQEGNDPRICPRCHNLAVQPVKKRDWFELFCVRVFPYSSSHEWRCGICQWAVDRNQPNGWQPMAPGQYQQGPPQGQYMQPGYGEQHMAIPANYQQQSGPKY